MNTTHVIVNHLKEKNTVGPPDFINYSLLRLVIVVDTYSLSIACSISSLSTHWLMKKKAHELALILISIEWVTMHLTFADFI